MILSYGQVMRKEHNAWEAYEDDKRFEEELLSQLQQTGEALSDLLLKKFLHVVGDVKGLLKTLSTSKKAG